MTDDTVMPKTFGDKVMAATRRGALAGLVIGAAGITASSAHEGHGDEGIFQHGVASGDPLQDRVIIWTRVSGHDGHAIQVRWELSATPGFERVIRRGSARAEPSRDNTVKVDVTGLTPGTVYYYRFTRGSIRSPIGLTRTAPAAGTMPATLRLAVVSCSNFPAGFFNVYQAIAARGDIDLVLHLGDYIYEYGAGGYATQFGESVGRIPDPPHEIKSLDDYRRRYRQYRSDPDLQAAHAAAPWMVTWDDHETSNDAWTGGAENHTAATEGLWTDRKAAALKAYYEWMPLRDPVPGAAFEAVNRRFAWGNLAQISMLETRLLGREEPLDLEKEITVSQGADGQPMVDLASFAAKLNNPSRQLLGDAQQTWLADGMTAASVRGTRWNVLGNQVIMARVKSPDFKRALPSAMLEQIVAALPQAKPFFELSSLGLPLNLDAWDGYPAARERVFAAARPLSARTIVVTGDTHAAWANHLRAANGELVGVEFGCSSVSSPSISDLLTALGIEGDVLGGLIADANEDVLWNAQTRRGFTVVELTPDRAEATFIGLDTITSPNFIATVDARFATDWAPTPQPLVKL
jgi:alkaline phosphatase D